MEANFRSDLHLIGISPSLVQLLEQYHSAPVAYLPNGIELDQFRVTRSLTDRKRCLIGFPSRPEAFKRTEDAIAAAVQLRTALGSRVEAWTFGREAPARLPGWIRFYRYPSAGESAELYNRMAVFLVPSLYEGWGLPRAEAMACRAALVSSLNGGVSACARDGETALLVPPTAPAALAEAGEGLLVDTKRRVALASAGSEAIRTFTWTAAVDCMEALLTGPAGTR